MSDDPLKAGGGIERAPADAAPTSISLTLLAARNAMTTACAATISSPVDGRLPSNFARARPVAASNMVRGKTLSGVLAASIASA